MSTHPPENTIAVSGSLDARRLAPAGRESAAEALPAPKATVAARASIEPMDPGINSIQPGGGVCMRIELAWGRLRRWCLKRFSGTYVARMQSLRRGEFHSCPQEILDPRDLKFYRNQGDWGWSPADDPFAWRDRLPFARVGLAELVIMSGLSLLAAVVLTLVFWPVAWIPLGFAAFVAWFFRNPRRISPTGVGLVVSPADGTVVSVNEVPHDRHIGGPAVTIGIFLSVFNVHINRAPASLRVVGLTYRPGRFLNALRAASARENEQLEIRLEENLPPYRRMIVRQIAGAIARRIVCWARPGDELERGAQFGMIKLGSRTELVLPREPGLTVEVRPGVKVKAGTSVVARFER